MLSGIVIEAREEQPQKVPASIVVTPLVMLCTVIDIRGDYAMVRYDDTGVESQVALFLLPFGVDVGDRLKFEDFEFTAI